jgi:hypothetical protein
MVLRACIRPQLEEFLLRLQGARDNPFCFLIPPLKTPQCHRLIVRLRPRFVRGEQRAETNQGAPEVPLPEELIQDLYASGIYVGIQTSSAGLMLLITDRYNRIRAEHLIGCPYREPHPRWISHQDGLG